MFVFRVEFLVGGFNPSEKYESNWIISEKVVVKKMFEATT